MRLCKSHVAIEEQSCKMYLDLDNSGIHVLKHYAMQCSNTTP